MHKAFVHKACPFGPILRSPTGVIHCEKMPIALHDTAIGRASCRPPSGPSLNRTPQPKSCLGAMHSSATCAFIRTYLHAPLHCTVVVIAKSAPHASWLQAWRRFKHRPAAYLPHRLVLQQHARPCPTSRLSSRCPLHQQHQAGTQSRQASLRNTATTPFEDCQGFPKPQEGPFCHGSPIPVVSTASHDPSIDTAQVSSIAPYKSAAAAANSAAQSEPRKGEQHSLGPNMNPSPVPAPVAGMSSVWH